MQNETVRSLKTADPMMLFSRPAAEAHAKPKRRFSRAVCSHPPLNMPPSVNDFIDGLQHRGNFFHRDTTALRTQEAIAWYVVDAFFLLGLVHQSLTRACVHTHRAEPTHHHTSGSSVTARLHSHNSSSTTSLAGASDESRSRLAREAVEVVPSSEPSAAPASDPSAAPAAVLQRHKAHEEAKPWAAGRLSPYSVLSRDSSPATSCSAVTLGDDDVPSQTAVVG